MNQSSLNNIFVSKIYSKLIECAVSGETVTTEELVEVAGLPKSSPRTVQNAINQFLSHITDFEQSKGRPMLTALIVQKNSKKPTKAWLKSYYSINGATDANSEVQAKQMLTAENSENCKALLANAQKKVVEYWSIPQL